MKNKEYATEMQQLFETTGTNMQRAMSKEFSFLHLTISQIAILTMLDTEGSMSVSEMSCGLKMVNSNVSNVSKRLEKMGLVVKERLENDQRVVKIKLTDEAKLKMPEIKKTVNNFHKKILGSATKKDLEDIKVGIEKVNRLLEKILAMEE